MDPEDLNTDQVNSLSQSFDALAHGWTGRVTFSQSLRPQRAAAWPAPSEVAEESPYPNFKTGMKKILDNTSKI